MGVLLWEGGQKRVILEQAPLRLPRATTSLGKLLLFIYRLHGSINESHSRLVDFHIFNRNILNHTGAFQFYKPARLANIMLNLLQSLNNT